MPEIHWTNPIIDEYLADPFIFRAEDKYWLVATGNGSDGRHLPIWVSDNLTEWSFAAGAVMCGGEGSWNRFNFWAPEVLQYRDRYWLYYTAKPTKDEDNSGNRVGLAVADSPAGPYEDLGVVIDHSSLDGSPFLDDDGQLWFYYVTDHGNERGYPAGKIFVDRLLDPARAANEEVCLVDPHNWQEGPVVFKQPDGRYRLTYSLGAWTNDTYRVAQAVADSPSGPFIESDEIIMRSTSEVKGPGHHNFFPGPDGERWLIYHGWNPEMTGRLPRIDRIQTSSSGVLSSDAPTSTPRRRESIASDSLNTNLATFQALLDSRSPLSGMTLERVSRKSILNIRRSFFAANLRVRHSRESGNPEGEELRVCRSLPRDTPPSLP